MKNIALIIAVLLISSFGYSQNGPKIEFKAKDNTIDYGTVSKKSDNGIRIIEFTNTGDAPLIVSNVLSTPGFSIPLKPNQPTHSTHAPKAKNGMLDGGCALIDPSLR